TSARGNASTCSPPQQFQNPSTATPLATTPRTTCSSSSTKMSARGAHSASTAAPPASSSSAKSPTPGATATPTPAPTDTATPTASASDFGVLRSGDHQRERTSTQDRGATRGCWRQDAQLAGVELDLPAGIDLPQGLHGQPE